MLSKNSAIVSHTRLSNLVIYRPGAKSPAVNTPARIPSEAWYFFFTEAILNEILEYRNENITETEFSL